MPKLSKAFAALAAVLLASPALAHVQMRYPPTGIPLDFLDNLRTEDLCGLHPNRADEAAAWQVPEFNTSVKTTALAGSAMDVSWDLHYAHNGGFKLELFDADMQIIREWGGSDNDTWGCQVDATKQNVTIDLPAEACPGCVLRFQRQALEWGATYLFRSCALLDIVAEAGGANPEVACNGCSGHGTCASGACTCDSSAATGFFYGTHCEYENECEADGDCGANGKCVNVGDASGPAKQCFCEAGFFGDVVTMPSGMQRRTCDRASSFEIDIANVAWDTFGEGYQRSLTSTADVFSGHLTPSEDTVEFAMQAKTTSWMAMGMRSVGTAATTPAAAGDGAAAESTPAAASEDAAADGEPAPQGEAPAAETPAGTPPTSPTPQAEGSGRRLRSRVPRILNGAATRGLLQAEETPAAAEATPAAGDAAAEETPDAAAEETPAAAGEDAPASDGVCADFDVASILLPGALGAGTAVNISSVPAASADGAAAEGEAPAAGAEAPAAEAAAKRRLLEDIDVPRMPLLEAESSVVASRMHVRRSLFNAAAAEDAGDGAASEDAGGAAAEGEDAGGATKEKEINFGEAATLKASAATLGASVAGGPCAGATTTPTSAHAMVNQDVVFGAAREIDGKQYFRIVDMFTPSRAKPQPDHMFCVDGECGTDDITDAWGAEIDGVTYMKYTRAIKTTDPLFTDSCISDDQDFHVIYAMGQLTANATHIPNSALETIPAANVFNKDFYQEDELKFHGGGIGTSFSGRGILGSSTSLNLFEDEALSRSTEGGACTPSSLAPEFDCQLERFDGNSIIHYKAFVEGDTGANLAVETPSETGWVAFGFHSGDGMMPGSSAVIATETAASGVGVFDLNGKSAGAIVEAAGATAAAAGRRRSLLQAASTNVPFSIEDASVERTGGRTLMRFTRPYDDTFTGAEPLNALTAYKTDGATLAGAHDGREAFAFSLSADGGVTTVTDPAVKPRRWHAILMIIGWGVLLPLGVAMANTLRTYGPVWYHLHRIVQVVGLLCATAAVIIALVKFESLDLEVALHRNHRALGLAVMVFGWFQPLNAVIRPHPPKEGEDKPILRLGWEILHKGLGYLTIILAVVVIFLGLEIGKEFPPFADTNSDDVQNVKTWRNTYIGLLAAVLVIWAVLLAHHFFWRKRNAAKKMSESSSDVKAQLGGDKPEAAMA